MLANSRLGASVLAGRENAADDLPWVSLRDLATSCLLSVSICLMDANLCGSFSAPCDLSISVFSRFFLLVPSVQFVSKCGLT